MTNSTKKAQATRRKTLFPMSSRQVVEARADLAKSLRAAGCSFYGIRQVLKCSPNEARNLVARKIS